MDYCHACRRHLNGALACPGCGTPVEGLRAEAPRVPAERPGARERDADPVYGAVYDGGVAYDQGTVYDDGTSYDDGTPYGDGTAYDGGTPYDDGASRGADSAPGDGSSRDPGQPD